MIFLLIKTSESSSLNIIFCFGETLLEKKKNLTKKIINKQIQNSLKGIKNKHKILFAYEPIWSIGTGLLPTNNELEKNILFIKSLLKSKFKLKNPIVLYGGSVNTENINKLKEIDVIDGFLVGGASLNAKKFIDIVKKTFN